MLSAHGGSPAAPRAIHSDNRSYKQPVNMHQQCISFTSLGLVLLDEIRIPNKEPLTNILGGSGTYG